MSKKDLLKISEYIDSLGIELPERNSFDKLNSWLPVPNTNEEVSRDPRTSRNFERGRLLYALVAKNKPKTILEIGTAEGYSTLCMAWAMSDYNIPGKIYTIDYQSHTKPVERIHYFNKDKSKTFFCSRKQLWEKVSNPKWIDKIDIKEGYAGEVLSNTTFPKIDMAYIDGNHFYEAARHDFFATLQITSKKFKILFDDYYSDFDPLSLNGENAGRESWEIPAYQLVDLHAGYKISITPKNKLDIKFSILNLLDATYISDAQNNDPYNAIYQDFDAKSAGVFFGLGRRFNLSAKFSF